MGVNGIYGLSGSGLDIESMVKVGMMSKQNEYDKMAQKFTKNEWTKAAYLELNSSITTFNNSTLSQYKMSSSMNAKEAESSSSAVKVTANASAAVMNHSVQVDKLSSNAYLVGTHKMTRYDGNGNAVANSTSMKLADVLFADLNVNGTGDDRTVSGTIAKVDGTTSTDRPVAASGFNRPSVSSNVSFGGSGQSIDTVAFKFTISDGETKDDNGNLKTVTIDYTYKELIDEGKTFNDLVSEINNSGLNIKASYDSVNDLFSFYNKNGGSNNNIQITLDEADSTSGARASVAARNFFDNMQLYQSVNGKIYGTEGTATEAAQGDGKFLKFYTKGTGATSSTIATTGANTFSGTDGNIIVDGVSYKTTDNKVTVGGVTYTGLEQMNSASNVSVTQDVDAIVDKVKSFVEDYNKLLATLYKAYDEKPESGYAPLTQTQKDGMKEEQITKWEEKAKTGLLYHDQTIGKIINEMRNALASQVEGVDSDYNSAYSIGISTTGLKGQLVLDETKLRKALDNDSDAVYNVFAKLGNKTTEVNGQTVEDTSYNGIAQRLGDILTTANKNIKTRAGSTADITEDSDLNNLLRQLQTKMSNFKRLMNSFEERLYKKYDAMEATLAKLGTQLNFVMGGNQ